MLGFDVKSNYFFLKTQQYRYMVRNMILPVWLFVYKYTTLDKKKSFIIAYYIYTI